MATKNAQPIWARHSIRVALMALTGIAAAAATGALGHWEFAALVGWAAACALYIAWTWLQVGRFDAHGTERHAQIEDPARATTDIILLVAALASLGALLLAFARASQSGGGEQTSLAIIAIVSVGLSWALIHTLHALRYARLYYRDGGGVDFNTSERPDYADFAYLAFTIGMTYQVSDTAISSGAIRRTALRHALISFLFGAVILACAINLVVGLMGG